MGTTLRRAGLLLLAALLPPAAVAAQAPDADAVERAAAGLELRAIGPAVMGGRIADVEVDPRTKSTWYVGVGSGNVWKTTNAGTTWTPIFDDQPSYSIGEVTLDPTDPDVVWVGTGENVSGRHVGWGDGVYRSRDAGGSWENVGLESSEHVGRILVDPRDGDHVLVAAEGPLWTPGGERGVFRSTDGGESWEHVLEIDENTGATDLEFHPGNPDVVYAATYQRRRKVWSHLAGGPNSGIWKSTDGGATWREVTRGLPSGDMGKIGIDVTPADPDRVYATIEADEEERGFYRSDDRGESWTRMNDYISGGTGPHYYQEIEASPLDPDLVFQMDVFFRVTRNGGETFSILGNAREKHSDNHALWIDPEDDRHLIAGTDAGLYESFDQGTTWRHFENLPVSQFYKLALGNEEPFYDLLGGAQDLGTLMGPTRTANAEGVRNRDWNVPLGADGYGVAFHPTDPDIQYMETQVGELRRYHRASDELINIQPQPGPDEGPERWNWDAPLLISPHDGDRLYFGSQRLWRSDDRGDSWTAVSDDLTRNTNRYTLEVMGRVWSVDALYDNGAMSQYATLTAISESPVAEGVLYAGSDDGLIHVSEDGGQSWRRAAPLPGVHERTFMNDVQASEHDPNTVFAVGDAHKFGDYDPHVFESTDRGRSWRSIAGDLPDGTIVWAIEQDHENPDLLFLGTEFGLYFSPNRGANWFELGAGVPTIPFRDVKLQRRDDDVVGATFGRGFYVLDDYGPLREIADGALDDEAHLFDVRDAWWYVPNVPMQAAGMPTLGSTEWIGENPPFGALVAYHMAETPTTEREERRATERDLRERGEDVPFPGYDQLRAERREMEPQAFLVVWDDEGNPVRRMEVPTREGLHRVAWDLRGPAPDPVDLGEPGFRPPWASDPRGPLVAPGSYEAEIALVSEAGVRALTDRKSFRVRPVPNVPGDPDHEAVAAFKAEAADLMRRVAGAGETLAELEASLEHLRAGLVRAPDAEPAYFGRIDDAMDTADELSLRLNGDPIRGRLNEPGAPSIRSRIGNVVGGHWGTRQAPTETQRRDLEIAAEAYADFRPELQALADRVETLEEELEAAGAPWTPGRGVPPR